MSTRSWVTGKVSFIRFGFHYNEDIEETETRFSGIVLARGDGAIVNEGIHDLVFCICKNLGNMSQKIVFQLHIQKLKEVTVFATYRKSFLNYAK